MSLTTEQIRYWRRKLSAFMHDNPSKAFDIKHHEIRAFLQRQVDELTETERYDKNADFNASAADRLPFPHAEELRVNFSLGENHFHHPLSSETTTRFPINSKLVADRIDEISQTNRTYLEESDARTDFIGRWRFWRAWCSDREASLAYLPADTRIPDHSIWNHLGMVSAFQGSIDRDQEGRAAFLLFTIGPVQSFIAAARNIRDLWSGSYLVSYLMSVALGELATEYGPDHLIFPNAWGQPLVDLQMRSIYERGKVREDSSGTLWDLLWKDDSQTRQNFLLPSLPNRFLAILPADEAAEFGKKLGEKVRERLKTIGNEVLAGIDIELSKRKLEIDPETFTRQVEAALEVHWHVLPMPKTIAEALDEGKKHLPTEEGKTHPSVASIERLEKLWAAIPEKHRTSYGMRNPASAWPVMAALNAWALDGVKGTRLFDAWNESSGWRYGRDCTKDSLTGKEEALLSVPNSEAEAKELSVALSKGNPHLLRANDQLGAMTILKRFWYLYYLSNPKYHDFEPSDFRMPNLHALGAGDPFGDDSKKNEQFKDSADGSDAEGGYYAVLALDGDEMGKWISGEKTPPVEKQIHPEALKYFRPSEEDKVDGSIKAFLENPRPLNPSFHLQFSEALSNFGRYAARRIVEAFDGRLIYAGGDDVLALLPADSAMECAEALRAAFRGETEELADLKGVWKNRRKFADVRLFSREAPRGYIRLHSDLKDKFADEYEPLNWAAMVPGPGADVSVGIAVGHIKSPLQDLVREAQAAEKRAKNDLNRGAVSVSLLKRSGEQIIWGTKWNDDSGKGVLNFYRIIQSALKKSENGSENSVQNGAALSRRFPYRMFELLHSFLPGEGETGKMDEVFATRMNEIIKIDLKNTLERQYSGEKSRRVEFISEVLEKFDEAWEKITAFHPEPADQLRSFLGVLQLAAWTSRSRLKKVKEDGAEETGEPTLATS